MSDDTQIIALGLTKPELFRASETLTLAVGIILIMLLVVRPAVNRALEAAREFAREAARYGPRPVPSLNYSPWLADIA
jgi:hypothetical protein